MCGVVLHTDRMNHFKDQLLTLSNRPNEKNTSQISVHDRSGLVSKFYEKWDIWYR